MIYEGSLFYKNDKKTEKKPHFYHNFIKKLHFSHKWFIIFA